MLHILYILGYIMYIYIPINNVVCTVPWQLSWLSYVEVFMTKADRCTLVNTEIKLSCLNNYCVCTCTLNTCLCVVWGYWCYTQWAVSICSKYTLIFSSISPTNNLYLYIEYVYVYVCHVIIPIPCVCVPYPAGGYRAGEAARQDSGVLHCWRQRLHSSLWGCGWSKLFEILHNAKWKMYM